MSSVAIALAVLACVLGAAAVGFFLNAALPGHHLNPESKDALKSAIGVVGTLTALVLGLLVGTAKNSYDAQSDGLRQMTTDIILLDQLLARYGPEASQVRNIMREAVTRRLKALWGETGIRRPDDGGGEAKGALGVVESGLRELNPANDRQHAIQSETLALTGHIARTMILTLGRVEGSIPTAFLFVLAGWLIVMFAGIGVLTPRNATARTAVVASALAFSSALLLILELDTPYGGIIRISDAPVRLVLEQLGK